MTERIVYLLRHAETQSSAPDARGDIARELTPSGRTQAARVGEVLGSQSEPVQQVLRSPAVRTAETTAGLRLEAPVTVDKSLYTGDEGAIILALSELGDDVTCALVVGHSPTIPAAAGVLADRDVSDPHALETLRRGYPTATLSRLEFDGDWSELGMRPHGRARLVWVETTAPDAR